MKASLSRVQLFVTPWTVAYQAVHGILPYWMGGHSLLQGVFPTQVSCTDRFFTISAIREALVVWNLSVKDPNINPMTLGQNVVFLCGKWF